MKGGTDCPGKRWSHHPWGYLKGTRFRGGLDYSELTAGLDDLSGLSQPQQFCDSITASSTHLAHPVPTPHAQCPQCPSLYCTAAHSPPQAGGPCRDGVWQCRKGLQVWESPPQVCTCSARTRRLPSELLPQITALPLPLLPAASPRHTETLQRVFNRGVAG